MQTNTSGLETSLLDTETCFGSYPTLFDPGSITDSSFDFPVLEKTQTVI